MASAAAAIGRIRIVLGASLLLLVARGGGMLLGLILQACLARALGAGGLGTYYTMVSLSGVAAVIGAVGYPSVASRFVARYRARRMPGLLALFLRAGLIDTAIVSVAIGAALGLASIALVEDPQLRWALILASLSVPPLATARFASAVAIAMRRFYTAFLPELVFRPAILLLLVGLTMLRHGEVGVAEVLVYYAAISWLIALAQFARLERPGRTGSWRPPSRLASIWRKLAALLMLTPLLTLMLGDVDLLLLWPLLDGRDVGLFGAALKIAMLFGFFVQIVHQTIVPELAEALHRRRLEALPASAVLAGRLAFAFVLFATLFVAVVGDRLLAVFGEEFVAARWPLVLLVLGLAPRAAAGPASQLLVVLGRERLSVAAGLLSVAYLAAANAALVPLFGLMGAALAFTSMATLSSGALSYLLWREEGVRADIFVRSVSKLA